MGTVLLKIFSADLTEKFDEFGNNVYEQNGTPDETSHLASQQTYSKRLLDLYSDATRLGYI